VAPFYKKTGVGTIGKGRSLLYNLGRQMKDEVTGKKSIMRHKMKTNDRKHGTRCGKWRHIEEKNPRWDFHNSTKYIGWSCVKNAALRMM